MDTLPPSPAERPPGDETGADRLASSDGEDAGEKNDWIRPAETADLLGVKRSTVYNYISRGFLRSWRPRHGRGSYLRRDEVERFAKTDGRTLRSRPSDHRSDRST